MSSIIDVVKLRDVINFRVLYSLPLVHHDDSSKQLINVCGTLTAKYDEKVHKQYKASIGKLLCEFLPDSPKLIVYFQGGPGFPCASPSDKDGIASFLLAKGYQIFYLDQRGTGYSTAMETETILGVGQDVDAQLQYVLNFRADSIVEDAECIRNDLLGPTGKWSVIGQSYGGFCIFTYLSKYGSTGVIREAIITGGVPPVGFHPDDVYSATYARTKERNTHYYRKYPQDVEKVVRIAQYLAANKTVLPNGGVLSVERFQTLGLGFGGSGGTDTIHQIVMKFDYDLQQNGKPTYLTLDAIQGQYSFDTNIIYALFQEAIYCDGNVGLTVSSNWSADRYRYLESNSKFVFDSDKSDILYFTGEMVYKSMYDDYSELRPLKGLAHAIHSNKEWSALYNVDSLRTITWDTVPIVAATYVYDQYVDFDLTRKVKDSLFQGNGNLRQYITSDYFHNGIRENPTVVLGALFDLLTEEID